MVFHIQPVAHIASVAVDRKLLAFQNVLDDKRNQFLGKMLRTVVVGTTGDGDRHLVCITICHYNHVGTCL